MGPITLFDKSFLQSLSVDESVWFDRHFIPVVSPIFYAETLADLAKDPTPRGPAEAAVRVIAAKFPEMSGAPCASHIHLCVADLFGHPVPMDGRVPMAGGRYVKSATRKGVVFEQSPEATAFQRWQQEQFQEVERLYAHRWRQALTSVDMEAVARVFRALGIDGKRYRTLDEIRMVCQNVVGRPDKSVEQLKLAVVFFGVQPDRFPQLIQRWQEAEQPPLAEFAPYAAHVISIEVFFQLSLAANLISSERPSNRTDIAYLFYLPFSMLFVSSDKLHHRCGSLFLRADQHFVWGPDLKADLARLNKYYLALPQEVRERGIMNFASAPPESTDFLTTQLWDRMMSPRWRQRPQAVRDPAGDKKLVAELTAFNEAPEIPASEVDFDERGVDTLSIERKVSRKKGQWWQVPKDLPATEGQ